MQSGDILIFKGKGWVFKILSWILRRLDSSYDGWGWHMGVAFTGVDKLWLVLEATKEGVALNYLTAPEDEVRVYSWFEDGVDPERILAFGSERVGCRYDVACYFWTALQYLVLHFFNRPIFRVLNQRYTCWELTFEFCREMGKPIQSPHLYPMLGDFLKAMENK